MRILSVETSAKTASAAIWQDGVVIGEYNLNAGYTHSHTIMPMIQSLLDMTGLSIDGIDRIAVAAGPGSFTGLRIGMAAVKGISFATGIECIPVSTLLAICYNLAGMGGIICPAMDARRDNVYTALYSFGSDGRPESLYADCAATLAEITAEIDRLDQPVTIIGDGAELVYGHLKDSGIYNPDRHMLAPIQMRLQKAASLAVAAGHITETVSGDRLLPVYLRQPMAMQN
ncbi:MAG: tRNA (adenosine(37)-N6)-threonylcarbamoyltransferase complex dimerization subunit type 1 TsaB [Oscillospiraceae bacterium]|nr:tRNA (adenosine(37)-N6)-threonylcarbamoyltransferase complex dimerization subunit type 1 TsaB [Oscillospiraceae bacterium]